MPSFRSFPPTCTLKLILVVGVLTACNIYSLNWHALVVKRRRTCPKIKRHKMRLSCIILSAGFLPFISPTLILLHEQGIIDPAFSMLRTPMAPCFCFQVPASYQQKSSPPISNGMLPPHAKSSRGKYTTAPMLLDLIKDVENAISHTKGRTGTAAGDVAFPKGKENLASVLKRSSGDYPTSQLALVKGPVHARLQLQPLITRSIALKVFINISSVWWAVVFAIVKQVVLF